MYKLNRKYGGDIWVTQPYATGGRSSVPVIDPKGNPTPYAHRVPWEGLIAARKLWEENQPKRPELAGDWAWVDDATIEGECVGVRVSLHADSVRIDHSFPYAVSLQANTLAHNLNALLERQKESDR